MLLLMILMSFIPATTFHKQLRKFSLKCNVVWTTGTVVSAPLGEHSFHIKATGTSSTFTGWK